MSDREEKATPKFGGRKSLTLRQKLAIIQRWEELKAKFLITLLSAITSVVLLPYITIFHATIDMNNGMTIIDIGKLLDYVFIVMIIYIFFMILINMKHFKHKKVKKDE